MRQDEPFNNAEIAQEQLTHLKPSHSVDYGASIMSIVHLSAGISTATHLAAILTPIEFSMFPA